MISVHELTKRFHVRDQVKTAVSSVSFQVNEGEVYGLLGPNGAGKTTSLRMIMGLMDPDVGYVDIEGIRTSDSPEEIKRRIGFVSASAGLYQWLTGREMLLFFADVYGLEIDQAWARLSYLADLLDLTLFLDQRCGTLSTGQKQRINLARALIHDPPIMLLDEPTRGLDVVGSKVIFDYIELLRQQKKAVIVSTHRLEQAQRVCDRFGLLNQGELVLEGTLEELRGTTGQETLVDMFLGIIESQPNETLTS